MANVILSLDQVGKNITVLLDQKDQMAFSLGDAQLVYTDLKWEEIPQATGLVMYDFATGRYKTIQADSEVVEGSENVVTGDAVYKHIEERLKDVDVDFTEIDPTVPSHVKKITTEDIAKWNSKIDNTVSNLINYYLKGEVYTKDEVNEIIKNINSFKKEIVDTLPTENIDENTIYLVSKASGIGNDYYDEYLYINGIWELIGTTKVDLTEYVKFTDYATPEKFGVLKAGYRNSGLQLDSSGYLKTAQANTQEIIEKTNAYNPLTPSNIDLAVKVGITTNTTELTDEEKAKVQGWLGITSLVGNINTELESVLGV